MRHLFLILLASTVIGCGSKSATPETAGVDSKSPDASATTSSGGAATPNSSEAASQPKTDDVVQQLVQRAQAALQARQGRVSVEALSQAIGIDAGNSNLFHMRADVYNLMGEYANARADFSLAVQLDPTNAKLYNARGYFLMTRGITTDSLDDFNKAVELDPKFPVAWNNRGLIRLANKNYEAAISDFTKAVEIDSKYVDALNNRGFARMKHGLLHEALIDLKATVKLKPDYTTAWNNCGLTYMEQENYDEAVTAFSEAVKLAPLDPRWLNHRHVALQKLGRFDEANADAQQIRWIDGLSQLTQTTAQKPGDPRVWMDRADHLAQGELYAAAIQDYSRSLTLQPGNKRALIGRASARLNGGEEETAIADCDALIKEDGSPMAHSIRGDAWLILGDYDKAIRDFEMAQRMDDVLVVAYQERAAIHKAAGKTTEAESDLAKASHLQNALAGKLTPRTVQEQLPFPTN